MQRTGWGVVDVEGTRIRHVANGVCRSAGEDLAARLCSLHVALTEVMRAYMPEAAAVEQTFVNKDAAGTLKLGQARGIALLVPAQAGLAVAEYAPNAVKKVVVGVGHARQGAGGAHGAGAVPWRDAERPGRGGRAGDRALPCPSCAVSRAAGGGAGECRRMIGKVSGRLDHRGADHVLIDTGGVGYVVHCCRTGRWRRCRRPGSRWRSIPTCWSGRT